MQNSATTIVLRMITGFASHILFSSVFCAGLVYFLGRPGEPRRLGRGLTLMLTAMVLHGLWDDTGGFIGAHTSAYIPVAALLTVLAVVVVTEPDTVSGRRGVGDTCSKPATTWPRNSPAPAAATQAECSSPVPKSPDSAEERRSVPSRASLAAG